MEELKLGVNIDHVATLRQARGTVYPDLVTAAAECEHAGAAGITIHLREDRRHVQDQDVFRLRERITTRLNLEMANVDEIVDIAVQVLPEEVCLVPERREELTTEGGLDVAGREEQVAGTVKRLVDAGIVVSLFVDPDESQLDACLRTGATYVELHTGAFCDAHDADAANELARLVTAARHAHAIGLNVNAGHGINLANIARILEMPFLDTLNIGHSIVARAVFVGLRRAVEEMLGAMGEYAGGSR